MGGDRTSTDALVRDLQLRLLTHVLHHDDGRARVLTCPAGERAADCDVLVLPDPEPDDHRVAQLAREAAAAVLETSPEAVAVAVTLRGLPDPHETLVVVAAHRDGTVLASAMHPVPTSEGVLAPGPLVSLDAAARELPALLVRALQAS